MGAAGKQSEAASGSTAAPQQLNDGWVQLESKAKLRQEAQLLCNS